MKTYVHSANMGMVQCLKLASSGERNNVTSFNKETNGLNAECIYRDQSVAWYACEASLGKERYVKPNACMENTEECLLNMYHQDKMRGKIH